VIFGSTTGMIGIIGLWFVTGPSGKETKVVKSRTQILSCISANHGKHKK
jgi:hypothetical protein